MQNVRALALQHHGKAERHRRRDRRSGVLHHHISHNRHAVECHHLLGLALGQRGPRHGAKQRLHRRFLAIIGEPPGLLRRRLAQRIAPMPRRNRREAAIHRMEQRDMRIGLGLESPRPPQPLRRPHVADDLARGGRSIAEHRQPLGGGFVGIGMRRHQRAIDRVGQQGRGAGDQPARLGDHLRSHVAGVARRAKIRHPLGQHRGRLRPRLRQAHAVQFRLVRRHDGGAAGCRDHRNAGGFRRRRLGEKRRRLHQRLQPINLHHPRPREGGAIGGFGPSERSGMRHRRARAFAAGGHFIHDQRLVRFPRQLGRGDHPARIGHPLEQTGNRPAMRILRQIGNMIGDIDVTRIASGQHVADGHAAFNRLRQRKAKRA